MEGEASPQRTPRETSPKPQDTKESSRPSNREPSRSPVRRRSRSISRSRSRSPRSPRRRSRSRSLSNPRSRSRSPRKRPSKSHVLFVKSIPKTVPEKDVDQLFSRTEGFVEVRKVRHLFFVEYKNEELASKARDKYQGYKFRSNDRPIDIDFDADTRGAERRRRRSRSPRRRSSRKSPSYDYYRSPYPLPHYHRHDQKPTLYVSDLPENVTERELNIMFRLTPGSYGFKGLRVIRSTGKTICFADFHDVQDAVVAMNQLQGFRIDPRDHGIRIEFDKASSRN
ncbi:U1 small nuclear ribonucleoprotein A [Acrasis kona]|uniref:U1 small nuclear ribonucleoprotein A n=1 Tax=Acrasis kona TaxID=1008807 RepID=A0AAW2YQJ2_9EUKA